MHHLSVGQNARRVGVGSALLGRVQSAAWAAGLKNIALDAWAANAAALRFFEAKGFFAFNLVLDKDLP